MFIRHFLFIVACFVIIFYAIALVFPFVNRKALMTKEILLVLTFALAIIGYSVSEPRNWDGYRHIKLIDQIRNSGIGFSDFLFVNKKKIGGSSLTSLLSFNILRYIIAKNTKDSSLIKFVCVFIDYSICTYILRDWGKTHKISRKCLLAIFILSFTCMPFAHTYSGLRCALASCITGLGIYLLLYKNRSIFEFLFLSFIAITIHQSVLVAVVIAILSKYFKGKKMIITVVISALGMRGMAEIFSRSSFMYLRMIGIKYLEYSSDSQYTNRIIYVYSTLSIIVLFISCKLVNKYFCVNKCILAINKEKSGKIIINFILFYMIYILCNIGNYDLVIRPAYLFAPLAPIIIQHFASLHIWEKRGGFWKLILVSTPCACMCGYIILLAIFVHVFRMHYLIPIKYYV